ncbi:MAG: universal stress protein [Deltaproteobacteria bacterium]|nr:MAG: universal stress protein [Deltaproteobacteria bacterium]
MKLQKLLVPIDFSQCSETAFKYARFLAKQFSAGIHLIHVVDKRYVEKISELNGDSEDRIIEQLCLLADKKLDSFLAKNNSNELIAGRKISVGTPFQAIALRAQSIDADMIVIGGHGRGGDGEIEEIFFGSAAERVVRLLPCPVLCIPQEVVGLEDGPT